MRVAYAYAGRVPVFGHKGEAVHVQEVTRALLRRGARVELLAKRLGGDLPAGLEPVRVHRLARTPGRDLAERDRAALAANDDLRDKLARLGRVDLVLERYSLWSYAGVEYARDAGVPGVLVVDGPRIEEAAARGRLVDRDAAERVARRALGAATAVIAISEGTARYLEREFDCDGRVHVAPLGVNPERYPAELLEERAAARRPFTVGFVGAFRPYHGLETLVDAFALLRRAHPDVRLLLVGDGPERPAVEARLEGLGVADGVAFVGAVPHEEVPAQLARMDAGVAAYPADRHYLSPMKVLEYLAAGLPVVASGVDQLADLIEDGRSGLLCGPDDPDSLAAGLERLASDPALRARLGTAGRDRVLAHYTWDAFVGRILELGGLA